MFPELAANPTYECIHLDLKRRFGIDEPILSETAEDIWERTKAQLDTASMRPQQLLAEVNVELLCTTDDPADDLATHLAYDRQKSLYGFE